MVQGGPGAGGKIWGLIELHDEKPQAVEATLIQAGLRWRDVESSSPRRRTQAWQDIHAVISTHPWDSPLARSEEQWWWGDRKHDVLVSILEATAATAVKTPNETKAKKADFVRIDRPWDEAKSSRRIGSKPLPISELDAWLDGDFTPVDDEEHGGKRELPHN